MIKTLGKKYILFLRLNMYICTVLWIELMLVLTGGTEVALLKGGIIVVVVVKGGVIVVGSGVK